MIAIGVIFVLGYISISGSFKNMMIGQITDSSIGHLQVHRKGFLASIETLPLTMNMKPQAVKKLEGILNQQAEIENFGQLVDAVEKLQSG